MLSKVTFLLHPRIKPFFILYSSILSSQAGLTDLYLLISLRPSLPLTTRPESVSHTPAEVKDMPTALTCSPPGGQDFLCPVTNMEEKAKGPEQGPENDGARGVDVPSLLQGGYKFPSNSK